MTLQAAQPLVALARVRLKMIQDGLHDLEQAIERNERSSVLGGLLMAQDHIGPLSALVDAAVLLLKERP